MENIRFSKELGRRQYPQGAGQENLCPSAYLTMGLMKPLLPESPQYHLCRVTCKLKHFWHSLRPVQGRGTAGRYGCSYVLAGWSLSTQPFLLSAGIAAAQLPWCQLAVQQLAHSFSSSCFPCSSFPGLNSFLFCSTSPFSKGNIRSGFCSSWRSLDAFQREQILVLKNNWQGRELSHRAPRLSCLGQKTTERKWTDVYQLFSTTSNHILPCICG